MGRLTETVENRFHVVADRAEVFVTKHARSMILATGLAISAVSGAAVVGEFINDVGIHNNIPQGQSDPGQNQRDLVFVETLFVGTAGAVIAGGAYEVGKGAINSRPKPPGGRIYVADQATPRVSGSDDSNVIYIVDRRKAA